MQAPPIDRADALANFPPTWAPTVRVPDAFHRPDRRVAYRRAVASGVDGADPDRQRVTAEEPLLAVVPDRLVSSVTAEPAAWAVAASVVVVATAEAAVDVGEAAAGGGKPSRKD